MRPTRLELNESSTLPAPRWARLAAQFRRALARAEGGRRRGAGDRPLLQWARHYLPAHFVAPPSSMHIWLADALDRMVHQRGSKLNVLAPRGHAKSTLVTLAYVLREALEGREPLVAVVSYTQAQANAHLENIKLELRANRALAADYPAAAGAQPHCWRAGRIRLGNDVVVEALGTGQSLRGRRHRHHRPTLIICDDLESDRQVRSAWQRENLRRWFDGALMKAGSSSTNFVNVGTALARQCLAAELTGRGGWHSQTFRAIEAWPLELDLWDAWEAIYCDASRSDRSEAAADFYHARAAQMDAGAELLWPERDTLYALMCMRAEQGRAAFDREMQNAPHDSEHHEWSSEVFTGDIWFDQWPRHLVLRTLALDPSPGAHAARGDYSAFVLLGLGDDGLLYVEADLARRSTPQLVAHGVALYRRFRPDAMGIEANLWQQLLADLFEAEFERQGLLGIEPWLIHNRVGKPVRIRRLGPYLEQRRLRFLRGSQSTRLLVEQLRDFPQAEHDDGPDALEMAIRLASDLIDGRSDDDGLGQRLLLGG